MTLPHDKAPTITSSEYVIYAELPIQLFEMAPDGRSATARVTLPKSCAVIGVETSHDGDARLAVLNNHFEGHAGPAVYDLVVLAVTYTAGKHPSRGDPVLALTRGGYEHIGVIVLPHLDGHGHHEMPVLCRKVTPESKRKEQHS